MTLTNFVGKLFICLFILLSAPVRSAAQINMGSGSGSASQDFAGLGVLLIPIWIDNITIPNWYAQRTSLFTTCTPSNGMATSGDLYNYGIANAADRSLGSLGSGTAGSFAWGVLLRNNSGAVNDRSTMTVSFAGEEWRYAANGAQVVSFYYKRSMSAISNLQPNNNATWTAVSSLNFTGPITTGSAGMLNGNLAANRVLITSTITFSPALADGEYIMLKWDDPDVLGADNGFSIDDVTINWAAAHNLPIELSAFSGKKVNKQTTLQWTTASETNNQYFEIESSLDENGFSSIGRIEGAINSQTKKNYTFIDAHPLNGINYYRLKQVDLDGSFSYSKIISLVFNPENKAKIYPNPATNTLNLIFNKEANNKSRTNVLVETNAIEIRLLDYLGKVIKTWNAANNTRQTSLDIAEISSGNYVVELQFENQIERHKITKY